MKANEKEIHSKDPNKYIVKPEGRSLNKKHRKELKRAQQMYVKDPLSVAQIPAAANFAQTQTHFQQTQTHKNGSRVRNVSSNQNAIIHFPVESQRANLT